MSRPENPRAPATAFVALGANLGDAAAALRQAFEALGSLPSTRMVRHSSLYRSRPLLAAGPDYVNAVAELDTALDAYAMLGHLQRLELAAGRQRPYPNAPRTLDLDLLLYGDARLDGQRLTVPHPRMFERAFVLVPLAEIAPARVPSGALKAVAGQAIAKI